MQYICMMEAVLSAESRYRMNCQGRLDGELQDNCK
jgi:hypothetical protein